jgi:hypothetical protein
MATQIGPDGKRYEIGAPELAAPVTRLRTVRADFDPTGLAEGDVVQWDGTKFVAAAGGAAPPSITATWAKNLAASAALTFTNGDLEDGAAVAGELELVDGVPTILGEGMWMAQVFASLNAQATTKRASLTGVGDLGDRSPWWYYAIRLSGDVSVEDSGAFEFPVRIAAGDSPVGLALAFNTTTAASTKCVVSVTKLA